MHAVLSLSTGARSHPVPTITASPPPPGAQRRPPAPRPRVLPPPARPDMPDRPRRKNPPCPHSPRAVQPRLPIVRSRGRPSRRWGPPGAPRLRRTIHRYAGWRQHRLPPPGVPGRHPEEVQAQGAWPAETTGGRSPPFTGEMTGRLLTPPAGSRSRRLPRRPGRRRRPPGPWTATSWSRSSGCGSARWR